MRKLLLIVMALALLVSCVGNAPEGDVTPDGTGVAVGTPADGSTEDGTPTPTPSEPDDTPIVVSVAAAGDNLIHSPIYTQAAKRATDGGYDFKPAYENLMELIQGADLSMLNQETLICNDLFPLSGYPRFNSPNALGDFLIDEMGFDVFQIVNNHTLDKGTDGLIACLDYWKERRAKALTVGAYYDAEDRADIRIKDVNGVMFSFLGYTEHLNGLRLPAGSPLEIGNSNELDTVCEEIRLAKEVSDVCVVFLHWGAENSELIQDYQRAAAKRMVEAGADIIIGTHPHVLRDIEIMERYEGDQTGAVVAYSLGNFISAQSVPKLMVGGVLTFDVVMNPITRQVDINDVLLVPTVTHYDRGYSFIRVYPLEEYTAELAAVHGVRSQGEFSMDFIYRLLKRIVSAEYLPEWMGE